MNKILLVIFILLAVFSRLTPHPPNFTPILSIALFSGLMFNNKYGFLIPLSIMMFSDFFIGSYNMAMWVYPSLLFVTFLGSFFIKKFNYVNVLKYSVIGSLIFFFITNFGSWYGNPFYPQSIQRLFSSYLAGIPFYKNTLISTGLYSSFLFLVYESVLRYNKQKIQSL